MNAGRGAADDDDPNVVVIGGGAAGTLAAVALLRAGLGAQIVERDRTIGPGRAYGTPDPMHLLNNYAGRLSAFDDDPDHFVRWCVDHDLPVGPDSFVQRSVYGWYLAEVLAQAEAAAPGRLARVRGEAVDVGDTGGEYVVRLARGYTVTGSAVVLALGNPPPGRMVAHESRGRRYVADPWTVDWGERVPGDGRVLLLGTGLTMVDVALRIAAVHPEATLVAESRHGLLPARHVRRGPRAVTTVPVEATSLVQLLRGLRESVTVATASGGDWRDAVDAMRPRANEVWRGLSVEDRERFVRHVAPRWEVLRHRMAPQVADQLQELRRSRRLTVRRAGECPDSGYDVVVNCTAPAPVPSPGWSLLMDHLIVRGLATPDRLGLGLDVDSHGALIGDEGLARGIFALGAARRGDGWEVAAIPDLRQQVGALAQRLVDAGESRGATVEEVDRRVG